MRLLSSQTLWFPCILCLSVFCLWLGFWCTPLFSHHLRRHWWTNILSIEMRKFLRELNLQYISGELIQCVLRVHPLLSANAFVLTQCSSKYLLYGICIFLLFIDIRDDQKQSYQRNGLNGLGFGMLIPSIIFVLSLFVSFDSQRYLHNWCLWQIPSIIQYKIKLKTKLWPYCSLF